MFAERVYLGLEKLKELRNAEVDEDDGYLEHHGIQGQKWGVRQGPPYPLHRSSEYDTSKDIYD